MELASDAWKKVGGGFGLQRLQRFRTCHATTTEEDRKGRIV